jgi:hypothetical protein
MTLNFTVRNIFSVNIVVEITSDYTKRQLQLHTAIVYDIHIFIKCTCTTTTIENEHTCDSDSNNNNANRIFFYTAFLQFNLLHVQHLITA